MNKFAGLGMAVETATRMQILHPVTRQPLVNSETGAEAFIEMLSNDSKAARAHDRGVMDKQLKMRTRKLTADELEADRTAKLAKLTKGWSLVTLDGVSLDVPYSEVNARELYDTPELGWLRDQALEFAADLGNFASGKSKAA